MIYFTSKSEIKTRVINPDNAINNDKKKVGQFRTSEKKNNRPVFPNQVNLGLKTSDLVFACLKVFRNTI